MQKQHSALIAAALAVLVVLVLAIGLFFSGFHRDNTQYTVTLPSAMETVSTANTPLSTENLATVQAATVTTQNVQAVVASLVRPTQYSCAITNTLYWEGGEGSLSYHQYVRTAAVRTDTFDASGNVTGIQMRVGENLYLWQPDDAHYLTLPVGDFSAGDESMIPDYQTLLDLPLSSLLDVQTVDVANDITLQVTALVEDYRITYSLSVLSGLLIAAEYWQDDTLVRLVEIGDPSTVVPDAALFILPTEQTPAYE